MRSKRSHARPGRRDGGIPADAPGAPTEGGDAGDASDLQAAYIRGQVGARRTAAKHLFASARKRSGHAPAAAESAARQALDAAARAFWWAEETDDEERQHALLDKYGRWTRKMFGCFLDFDGHNYSQPCPVAIAHKRLGLSPGFVADKQCSVCAEDLSECSHRRDRAYWVRGGASAGRFCAVCLQDGCEHSPEHLYRVRVIGIVRNVREAREISFVARPAQPEARPAALPVDTQDLSASLGPDFRPGTPVSCDMCLTPCRGIAEFRMTPADVEEPTS